MHRGYDQAAATAAIGYIASKIVPLDLHKSFKLLYLAEKACLGRYGRQFIRDDYIAMDYGPVPSTTYDLAKAARGEPRSYGISAEMVDEFKRWIAVDGSLISARRDPDLDELSRGALECLDEVIDKYASWTFNQLTQEAHDAAWRVSRSRGIRGRIRPVDIARALPDSDTLIAHLTIAASRKPRLQAWGGIGARRYADCRCSA